jgi:hypothetical protein
MPVSNLSNPTFVLEAGTDSKTGLREEEPVEYCSAMPESKRHAETIDQNSDQLWALGLEAIW